MTILVSGHLIALPITFLRRHSVRYWNVRFYEQRKKRRLKRIIPTVIAVAAVLAGILFTPSLRYMNTDTPSASNILAVDKNNVTTNPVDKWIKELSDEELEELVSFSENDIFLN